VTATTHEPKRPDGDPACTVRAVPVSRPFTWLARLPRRRGRLGSAATDLTVSEATLFGLTEAQIAEIGATFGIGAFIAYLMDIIGDLAKQSKAGKLGTFICSSCSRSA